MSTDFSVTRVAARLRVPRALAELPPLCAAVKRGDVSWSAARELSRVATPDTVDAWIEAARGETVRDVGRAVSGRVPGDLPTDPPDDAVRRHVVRLEVEGEPLALLRAARERLVVDSGGHVDDDALVRGPARAVLDRDAGDDPGRAAAGPRRPSRLPSAARSCDAITGAAPCPGAGSRASCTSTT
jgi:hypothetical protein